jgi:hypothetical protein
MSVRRSCANCDLSRQVGVIHWVIADSRTLESAALNLRVSSRDTQKPERAAPAS